MTTTEFLRVLYEQVKHSKAFDEIEGADEPGANTLRVYPFTGPPLIITVRRES